MCLLVYKQPQVAMPLAHAVRGGTGNRDGFGIAWHDGQRWQLHHTLDLLEHCRVLPDVAEYPALIHYRLATHGTVSLDNCHPFLVGEPDDPNAFVVAHNGMFSSMPRDAHRSDTRLMVDHVFSHLRPGWADDPVLRGQLQQLFGGWNKVAVLFPDGTRVLFGEKDGHWEPNTEGTLKQAIWYSNGGYRDYSSYKRSSPAVVTLPETGRIAGYIGSGQSAATPDPRMQVLGSPTTALPDDEVLGMGRFVRSALQEAYCLDCWDMQGYTLAYDPITKRDVEVFRNSYGRYTCSECGRTMTEVLAEAEREQIRRHSARQSALVNLYD